MQPNGLILPKAELAEGKFAALDVDRRKADHYGRYQQVAVRNLPAN